MSAWRSELNTKEAVLDYYEDSPLVRYKVYAGNKPDPNYLRWEFNGTEKQEGLHKLGIACDAILSNPSNINSYTLQLIRSDAIIKQGEHKAAKRIQDAINIVFQLNFDNGIRQLPQMQIGATRSDDLIVKALQAQTEQLNALTSLLTAKIGAAETVEPEDDEPLSIGSIGERVLEPVLSVLDNPILQNALADKIAGWLMPNNKPIAMAGITQDENEKLIQQAISILKQHDANLGNDLMKLAEIAQKDINQFNMLLTVLRGQ